MAVTLGTIQAVLSVKTDEYEAGFDRASSVAQNWATNIQGVQAAASAALGAVGAAALSVAGDMLSASMEFENVAKTLRGAFSGVQLEEVTAQVAELGASGSFTEAQFARLSKQLSTFRGAENVTENLSRVADLADGTGQSLESLGLKFAKFGSSARDSNALLKELGDQREVVDFFKEFGVQFDDNNKILLETAEASDQAREALNAFVDSKFAGASSEVVTPLEALNAELKILKQESGQGLLDLLNEAASLLTPVVKSVGDLSIEAKAGVGIFTAAAGAMAAFGGAIGVASIAIVAYTGEATLAAGATALWTGAAGTASVALGGLASAATAAGVTLGALAAAFLLIPTAIAAVSVALLNYRKDTKYAREELEKLVEIEERRAKALDGSKDLLNKTAEELQKQGVKAEEFVDIIGGLQDKVSKEAEAGNKLRENAARAQLKRARDLQAELAKLEKAGFSAEASVAESKTDELKAEAKNALATKLQQIKTLRAENKLTADQEIEELKRVLSAFELTQQERLKIREQIANKERQLEKDEAKGADPKKALQERLEVLSVERREGKKNNQEALKELQALLKEQKAGSAEELQLRGQIADLQKQINDETASEGNAKQKEAFQERIAQIKTLRAENKISVEQERESLRALLQDEQLTTDQRKAVRQQLVQVEDQIAQSAKQKAEERAAAERKVNEEIEARIKLLKDQAAEMRKEAGSIEGDATDQRKTAAEESLLAQSQTQKRRDATELEQEAAFLEGNKEAVAALELHTLSLQEAAKAATNFTASLDPSLLTTLDGKQVKQFTEGGDPKTRAQNERPIEVKVTAQVKGEGFRTTGGSVQVDTVDPSGKRTTTFDRVANQ